MKTLHYLFQRAAVFCTALVFVATTSAQTCVPTVPGMVGWWSGDGTAYDASYTNHGTLVGNTTYSAAKVGSGFRLDGNADGVFLGDAPALQLQNFTIETWVKRSSTTLATLDASGHGHIFCYGGGGYVFGMKNNGSIDLGKVGSSEVTTSPLITDTNFHHVAVTKTNSLVIFYVDGTAVAAPSYNPGFSFGTQAAIGYIFAGTPDVASNGFFGVIDEFAIYNRALSASEIQSIISASGAGKCKTLLPVLLQQPRSMLAAPGDSVSFGIVASGTPPLTFQWTFNGANVNGATNSTLTVTTVTTNQTGYYNAIVSNTNGSTISSNANLFVVTNQSCIPPRSGIVGWWNGNGETGDLVTGALGSFTGNATYAPGVVGQAFTFDGSGDAVVVGNPAGLQVQNFTLEAWIKRASTTKASQQNGTGGVIFGYGSDGYALVLQDDGHLALSKVGSSGVFSSSAITDTNYHHVALSKTNGIIYFYIDGVASLTSSYDPGFSFGAAAAIGARGDDLSGSFLGMIDELSIYNRALSVSEIQGIFAAGNSGKCSFPIIFSDPQSQTIGLSSPQTAVFSGAGGGSGPVAFQWFFNGADLVNATNVVLQVDNVTSNQLGDYFFTVSNPFGVVTSRVATLIGDNSSCTAPAPGLIAWWQGNGSAADVGGHIPGVLRGNTAYVSGKSGLGFSFDGVGDAVDLGTPSSLQLQNFTIEAWVKRTSSQSVGGGIIFSYGDHGYAFGMNDNGNLLLSKAGIDGVFSGFQFADFDFHHVAVTRTNGLVVFYLDGVASPPLSYGAQFEFYSPVSIGARGDFAGGSFIGVIDEVAVYNRALAASEIQAVFNAGSGTKCILPPLISMQPQATGAAVGQTAQFSVLVDSIKAVSYQWCVNNASLPGATNATLIINNAQTNQAGDYFVVVSNTVGVVTSGVAHLSVVVPPAVTNQPQSQIAIAGNSVTFSVSSEGTLPLNYQWLFNGTSIVGATNATLTISNALPENVGSYQVVITNAGGGATSAVATLSLNPLIFIGGQISSSFTLTNSNSVPVQITSTSSNATIFYTLDGSPADFNALTYSGPFSLTNSATIRAIVYDANFNSFESSPVSVTLWFTYALTVNNPGGGSVSLNPPGGIYRNDKTVEITAVPTNGWNFLRWGGDAAGTSPVIDVTMERSKTVQAIFGTTVTAPTNQNGAIKFNPSLAYYPYGSLVQIAAIPNSNFSFGIWGGSANGNTNPLPFTVINPAPSISALFSTLTAGRYALTVVPNGQGTVSVNPRANVFTNGQVVTITASPIGTNQFLLWSGNANGTNDPLSVTMDASKVIIANFRGGDYPINLNATLQTNKTLQFLLSGEPQRTFDIETSSNLLNWTWLTSLTNSNGTSQFVDQVATNFGGRFYRARSQ